jgi:selenocysteine lyase/cysteine desulfurase
MRVADQFQRPGGRYFLSHSVGLLPKATERALGEGFLDPWARGDGAIWDGWLTAIDAWRAALGGLLGAAAADLCPQTNISSALTKLVFSLPARAGRRKIVASEDDFPTIGFVLEQARRGGYEVELLPGGARLVDPDAWAAAFRDDVQLVHATHVFSNSSLVSPIGEIIARARAAGVFSAIDIAQSAGCMPIDLAALRPDFALGTSVKYLCGGPGACFLYVDRETARLCAPTDVGWFSHENPFEFDIRRFRYAEGALRFWGGTPSVAPYALARAGLETLGAAGIANVRAHNQRLIRRLIDRLGPGAMLSETRAGLHGSSAILKAADAEKTSAALAASGLLHDRRMGGLRVSAHLYSTEEDIDALCDACERAG